ncbi:MAG: hypothetical protein LIO81_07900 [Clostridiales bacterium]|nr:hypothetical protein [Clostridiales bacterium]
MSKIFDIEVDQNTYNEYSEKKFALKSDNNRQTTVAGLKIMATSSDYDEFPEIQAEAREIIEQIKLEIRGINSGRGIDMRHETFSGYLGDIRDIYENAIEEYSAATAEMDEAEKAWQQKRNSGLSEREEALAKATYYSWQDNYSRKMAALNERVKGAVSEVQKSLELKAAGSFYALDSKAIDHDALYLLDSGIMDVSDLESMSRKFINNPTMSRLIAKRCDEIGGDQARELSRKLKARSSGSGIQELVNSAIETGNSCIGSNRAWSKANAAAFDRKMQEFEERMREIME